MSLARFFLFGTLSLRRKIKMSATPKIVKAHIDIPTPVPTLTLVERLLPGEEFGVAEIVGLEVDCSKVLVTGLLSMGLSF